MNKPETITVGGTKATANLSPSKELTVMQTPRNRAERRRSQRAMGNRGAKAKRTRQINGPSPEELEFLEAQAQQERVIESAQNLRNLTKGRFYLPGDK